MKIKPTKRSYSNRFVEGFFVGLGIGVGIVILQLLSTSTSYAINTFLLYTGL